MDQALVAHEAAIAAAQGGRVAHHEVEHVVDRLWQPLRQMEPEGLVSRAARELLPERDDELVRETDVRLPEPLRVDTVRGQDVIDGDSHRGGHLGQEAWHARGDGESLRHGGGAYLPSRRLALPVNLLARPSNDWPPRSSHHVRELNG
jgi:hypothetical protein